MFVAQWHYSGTVHHREVLPPRSSLEAVVEVGREPTVPSAHFVLVPRWHPARKRVSSVLATPKQHGSSLIAMADGSGLQLGSSSFLATSPDAAKAPTLAYSPAKVGSLRLFAGCSTTGAELGCGVGVVNVVQYPCTCVWCTPAPALIMCWRQTVLASKGTDLHALVRVDHGRYCVASRTASFLAVAGLSRPLWSPVQ